MTDLSRKKRKKMKNKDELLDEYRRIYIYYNEDTLKQAVINHPELVKEIIKHPEIRGLARAYGLHSLGQSLNPLYFEFIKNSLQDPSPFLREAAALALCEYYCEDKEKYIEVKVLLEEALKEEKGEGVVKQLKGLLDYMEHYI